MSSDYFIPGVLGKKLDLTWSQIKDRTKTGDFTGINIGDYLEMTDPNDKSRTLKMRVAGIDTYARAYNGNHKIQKHHIDFISSGMTAFLKLKNTADNNGSLENPSPYINTAIPVNSTFILQSGRLPEDLAAVIIDKYAYLETKTDGVRTENDWVNLGKFWIPTEYEILGKTVNAPIENEKYACQYPIFANNIFSRVMDPIPNGLGCSYWLADSAEGSDTKFCIIDKDGVSSTATANKSNYIPLCFRIGTIS